MTFSIFGKAYHLIRTCIEVFIVRFYALKERSKVVIRVTEIIQFYDFLGVWRQINFIFRSTINEVTKLTAVIKPAAMFLCPFTEPYQLDRFASRCSRKSLNLFKDSSRGFGCCIQYATLFLISAFTFL